MFETIKLYIHKEFPIESLEKKLVELGYKKVEEVFSEGDFSRRGDTLEILAVNFNFPLRIEWELDTVSKIYSFDRSLNKKIIDYDFIIIIPHFLKAKHYKNEDIPLDAVLRIKKNDYVVHTKYGIGKFLGIKKINVKGKEDYYFQIEYFGGDKLYVSKEEAHLIQKYISFSLRPPNLSKLDGRDWTRTKEKVLKGIRNYALELLNIEAQRKLMGGFKYSADTDWQRIFESTFPYQETDDQKKAMGEVKQDMSSNICMDRLICGDVGYGKTEIAMRAAFKAVMDNKQVAFLVPTTILAYQHYTNFLKRLADFPVKVEQLSRFKTAGEQKKILQQLKEGKIDIIVGTHRLLSRDVEFNDLGLLIIDEEQRFGVEHKEKIKKLKVGVDVLTLTATPIPRTLYMSLIGIKNISILKTPPKHRLAVKTKIIEFSPKVLAEIITTEIERDGQAFFIHNRIDTIYDIFKKIVQYLPKKVKPAVVHGRLSSREIETIMLDFIEKRLNCLFSTAIVESGIDIPSANTIIINDAHNFGLADLHQLRGRVGRFNIQAYAYLVIPNFSSVSNEALERLRLIEEFSHLGAGFEVAMSDLELRGAGNLLGKEQHGFVWMVGFDLYCRLLKKEIEYLKEAFKINN
ncbi:MAG: transcription-repair coupling factor [Candidatus Omnitrophica bacterium]|nr:transcription-repair coupling factor [Candidatus Omnitrophota bacterium]